MPPSITEAISTVAAPSTRGGMGAIPFQSGTTFRVWAPNADAVFVAGDFNGWSAASRPLAREDGGYWSVDVPGVGPGAEYKFVIARGDERYWRADPYARDVTSSVGNALVVDPSFDWGDAEDSYRTPPWNELVIYEIHVGTFNDVPGGPPGTLARVVQRLDHLSELGVNAIELMPTAEFPGGHSWGYNPSHLFAVESDYGRPRALRELVREAHARGIAVLLDVVYNHFGPSDLGLWRFDGWYENDGGGIYFYNDWRSGTPWGDTRPDYGRPEVRQVIRDNALRWLEDFRIDGLRWDATSYIRNVWGRADDPGSDVPDGWNLMRWVNDEIDTRQSWKISIAEDMRDDASLTRPTSAGGAGFDAQWDARFVDVVRRAIIAGDDARRDVHAVADVISDRPNGDAFERVIYTESHDEVANGRARVPHEIWPSMPDSFFSKKRSTLGAAIVFTSPGVPMLFQGQELLEDQWFRDIDPIDWSKKERYQGIFELYRDLVRLRRNWFDSTRGLRGGHVNVFHVNPRDKVIAYHRWDRGGVGDDVVVVVNMSNRAFPSYTTGMPRGGAWRVRFNSDWSGYDRDFGNHPTFDTTAYDRARDGMDFSASLGIGAYSGVVLSQD